MVIFLRVGADTERRICDTVLFLLHTILQGLRKHAQRGS